MWASGPAKKRKGGCTTGWGIARKSNDDSNGNSNANNKIITKNNNKVSYLCT